MIDAPAYRREDEGQPPSLHPPYASTRLRAPLLEPVAIPQTPTEVSGPGGALDWLAGPAEADLTRQHRAAPLGQRIILEGRVQDDAGRPLANTLIEVWQANAAGRYIHARDQWDAPVDPNFTGVGRVVTDGEGRYRIVTVKPGAYPWGNHPNAWRPAHVHFSLMGPAFATRLVTQCYFEGDPLIPLDPIAGAVPEAARERLLARLDMDRSQAGWALAYVFDLVLRGRAATPMEA